MEPLLLPLLLIAVLALPLVLGSRRQKRAMAEAQRLQDSLIEGDEVMTTSGLYATVVDISDERTVDLEIAPGVRATWLRAAIREKISDDSTTEDDLRSADAGAGLAPASEDRAGTDKP
ncbi:MAG TPA: preprotein translocase subunit YajC [Pseudonocardiaceae bacterium]|jgi:preprotein translocase subunit YajC|nr:preprotein translocase subunit YajC [Pseudonocardiaceae bacterium]